MTGLPTLQVLLDDGTGTFPFDITSKCLLGDGLRFTRGRDDWQGGVSAASISLTLNNSDGRFTPGSTVLTSPTPIKVDQRIRIKATPGGNLIATADAASFEGSTGGWSFNLLAGARTAGTSLAQSATRATDGTNSLLATWSTSATGNFAALNVATVIGQTYTVSADVYVPTGSPNVRILAAFIAGSTPTALKDQWVRLSVTFTATATTTSVGIDQSASTAGQTCYIDSVALNVGSSALTFAAGGSTSTRFTGYVKSWPVAWPATVPTFSTVVVTATDAQARAERHELRSVIEQEILADLPGAYYMLNEPSTATAAADSSGNQAASLTQAGTGAAVVFGSATGPATDGLTAATFAAGQYLTAYPVLVAGHLLAFSTTTVAAATLLDIGGAGFSIDGTGHLTDGSWTSPGVVTDGAVHVIEQRWGGGTNDTYFDGALVRTSASGLVSSGGTLVVGRGFTGSISHVALWPSGGAPSGTRVIAHETAILNGFAGESGTARLSRTAGYANLPTGTFDTSLTNVAFTDITAKSVWAALQEVADAEGGVVFFDGSGNLIFHNRNRPTAKTAPDLTLTAASVTPDVQPVTDDQQILNYLAASSDTTGVTQVVQNAASITAHGKYPGEADFLVQTDPEALDRANWLVANYAEPTTRYGTLTINLYGMTPALAQSVLSAIEINAWLRITGAPSQTPGSTTIDVVVEGYTEELTADSWTLSCNVIARSLFTAFILDSATFGVLDSSRLYF